MSVYSRFRHLTSGSSVSSCGEHNLWCKGTARKLIGPVTTVGTHCCNAVLDTAGTTPATEHSTYTHSTISSTKLLPCGRANGCSILPILHHSLGLFRAALIKGQPSEGYLGIVSMTRTHCSRSIQQTQPELLVYVEAAGITVRDDGDALRTHWNLCGSIALPYIANGEITDLRLRRPCVGSKTKSLPGSPGLRGATTLKGWDLVALIVLS